MSKRFGAFALLVAATGVAGCGGDKSDTYSTPTDADADTDVDTDTDTDTDADTDSTSPPTETGTVAVECTDVVVVAPLAGTVVTTSTSPATDTAIGTGTGTGTDSGGGPGAPYTYLTVGALFGINVSGCIDEVLLEGEVIDSSINLTFGDEAWRQSGFDPANVDHYCTVSLLLATGTENPSWVTGWYGVEHDAVSAVTDCADETPLGPDPVAVLLGSGANGVEIGGPMDPYVVELLTQSGLDPDDYFAGGLRMPLIGEAGQISYGVAYEVDASQNLVLTDGNLTPLDPATLPIAPGLVREALYQVSSLYYFQF
ncbi:MAG: hypothetical protein ABMA64_26035 [Myxococcota bacterium]